MSDHMQQARWCLYCDSATHFSHECRSTHGINTPQAVELHRLLAERAALAARVGVLEAQLNEARSGAYLAAMRAAVDEKLQERAALASPIAPVEAAPETPAEPVAQEPRALADLPDSLRCHPGVKAAIAAARAEGYAAGRAAGMEEAAKVCENETQEYEQYTGQPHNLAYQCADAIRAAKGESATPAAKPGE